MRARVPWPAVSALLLAASFALVATLVATGATQSLDTNVIDHTRPGDVWGPEQVRLSPWMARLDPQRMFLLLAVTSLLTALRRRSWGPVLFAAALTAGTTALTLVTKFALRRPDPHGYITTSGGSYPSGHMVALVVCLGGCLLILQPRVRWWLWAPVVAAAALMTTAQLVSAAHWATDLLGGGLLALALVSGVSGLQLRRRAVRSISGRTEPPSSTRAPLGDQVSAGTARRN